MSEEKVPPTPEVTDLSSQDKKPIHEPNIPYPTPMLDELESGPWPSFVTGLKRLAKDNDMANDLMGQLETSYETKKGYWKGGTVGVYGYGGGIIPRFTELKDKDGKALYPAAAEFHTMRVQPPAGMHYDTNTLRKMADMWEKHGSGLIAFHGQSGDIMFQGIESKNVQPAFDELNEMGFDLGGAGPALRTSMSCVGAARCELSCYDEARALRTVINNNLDDMHRPALPYKFKFKFSGCGNDCVNAIQRSDMATLGTWRDNMQVNESLVKAWVAKNGKPEMVNQIISLCPSKALAIKAKNTARTGDGIVNVAIDDVDVMEIDNHNCVRCMHCLNVIPGGLLPGKDKGVTILVGGKGVLKIGATLGTVVIPFMKLESDEDFEKLNDLARSILDFFAENALEHERTGEMIDRIGLVNFLDGIGLEVDSNMIAEPRNNPYFRGDGWQEEAMKAEARRSKAA